jgi:hypothetical protein
VVIVSSTVYMLVKYSGEAGISVPEIMFWRQAACTSRDRPLAHCNTWSWN